MRTADLAREMGVAHARIIHTMEGCLLPVVRIDDHDGFLITEETAERIRTLYRNAGPSQTPRPTPMHLREEFDAQERAQARQDRIDSDGPTRGDRP